MLASKPDVSHIWWLTNYAGIHEMMYNGNSFIMHITQNSNVINGKRGKSYH